MSCSFSSLNNRILMVSFSLPLHRCTRTQQQRNWIEIRIELIRKFILCFWNNFIEQGLFLSGIYVCRGLCPSSEINRILSQQPLQTPTFFLFIKLTKENAMQWCSHFNFCFLRCDATHQSKLMYFCSLIFTSDHTATDFLPFQKILSNLQSLHK